MPPDVLGRTVYLMESLINFIQPYFEHWGYLIVFVMAVLENAAFVGAVVPGDVVLLLAGFYVQRSSLNLAPVIILAFIGAVIGDSLGYAVGRYGGRKIVDRFGGGRLLPHDRLERVEEYFKQYGMWAVALGRLAPIIRTVNTFTAGMAKMPFYRFLIAVAVAAGVWTVTVPTLGFLFSGSLEAVKSTLGWVGVVVLVVFAGAIVFTYRRFTTRLAEEGLRKPE